MWLIFNERLENPIYSQCLGKSLLLCQKFEFTCKDIVMWLSLSKSFQEKQFISFSQQHYDYVDFLHGLFLGQNIKHLRKKFQNFISENDFQILTAAKNARDFICHEIGVSFLTSNSKFTEPFQWDKIRHKNIIKEIALGDYLVSRWSYEFLEKESGSIINKDAYIINIIEWVFGIR